MKSPKRILFLLMVFVLPAIWAYAQTKPQVKRVKLPDFKNRLDLKNIFFDNPQARLEGPRQINTAPMNNGGSNDIAGPPDSNEGSKNVGAWASLISSTTLEDEIKATKLEVDRVVGVPGKFKGGDYQAARLHFSTLAAMFGVITEYDGDVRWKKQATGARDAFGKVAANCKVGTDASYNESKLRKADLEDLVGGASPDLKPNPDDFSWAKLIDRTPIMQRLEIAFNERLKPWTSDATTFESNVDKVFHEAEIVAALSEMLVKPEMQDGEDEDYMNFSSSMKAAARDIVDAVKLNDAERASKAVGEISKACTECHEYYRA
ncbi:MAG: hypothetical protein VX776_07545 [Planctomycetota bacterium]|nr:hypothetical protein [Planctomycetota bacterium]